MLKWHEVDVVDCLEVLPVVDDHRTQHVFEVSRSGLSLRLTIWQYDRQAQFVIAAADAQSPIIAFCLVIRGDLRYLKENRIERLEFTDVVIGPAYHWSLEHEAYSTPEPSYGCTVALSIKPVIRVEVLDYLAP